MTTEQTDLYRDEVEAIKASWKEDPCWDLDEFDPVAAEMPHLIAYAEELRQFAREAKAKWQAERDAEYKARIDKLEARVLERLSPEHRAMAKLAPIPQVVRSLCEEVWNLWEYIYGTANVVREAHARLDEIGAPRVES